MGLCRIFKLLTLILTYSVHVGHHKLHQKQKSFSKKKTRKDLDMACHTPPLKKSEETRGNAITQPLSYPIRILGWDGTEVG